MGRAERAHLPGLFLEASERHARRSPQRGMQESMRPMTRWPSAGQVRAKRTCLSPCLSHSPSAVPPPCAPRQAYLAMRGAACFDHEYYLAENPDLKWVSSQPSPAESCPVLPCPVLPYCLAAFFVARGPGLQVFVGGAREVLPQGRCEQHPPPARRGPICWGPLLRGLSTAGGVGEGLGRAGMSCPAPCWR